MKVKLDDVIQIYEQEVRKNTKNKKKIYQFERYKMVHFVNIVQEFENNSFQPIHYNIFLVRYPKYRVVMALNIKDKVVNHYITRYILMKNLERYLDDRNVATRKNMGRDYAIRKIKGYIEKLKKYEEFYVLKLDISKYFYNIDHDILKKMLQKHLSDSQYQMIVSIIDSTNCEYINREIIKLKENELQKQTGREEEIRSIPLYQKGKGLPIGNMSSQFLAIYYLNELDYKIVHDFHLKYYVRYMDDFVIFSPDKEYLKKIKEEIEHILDVSYRLKVNQKKTHITNSREGFTFCGYRFRVISHKTVIHVSSETRKRVKKRIKEVHYLFQRGKMSLPSTFSSISTYSNGFRYGSSKRMKRLIDRYFYQDKEG